MGIGNLRCPRPCGGLGDSLPLMGIGNSTCLRFDSGRPRLITPHGDREPAGAVRVYGTGQHLITPHGDREPGCDSGHARLGGAHYPSWGSGTRSCNRRPGRTLPHYPSWGSGTTAVQHATLMQSSLITPHGDRELDTVRSLGPVYRNSLPLMGIGNSFPACWPLSVYSELITPHGDRELAAPGTAGCHPRAHYPSWGSGTCSVLVPEPSLTESHYPSWGSGT